MPGDPRECREHAKRCHELASGTSCPVLKESLTEIANRWMKLATELDATKRLLEEWGDPRFVDNPRCVLPLRPRKLSSQPSLGKGSRVVFVQHRITCSPIKLLQMSDDSRGKLNVLTVDQRNPTAELFVESPQGH